MLDATGASFQLGSSAFPLVDIAARAAIGDDPKVPALMTIAWPGKDAETIEIGVEWRGFSALWWDKKNFDLEVVDGDVEFPGLRKDDDWVLNGMPDEPARLRSYLAQALWLDVARRPASFREAAVMGARTRYVELNVDGDYRGVYLVGEQIDRKQLDLSRGGADDRGRGELFKAGFWSDATSWTAAPAYDNAEASYEQWEQKYPDPDDGGYDYAGLYAALQYAVQPDLSALVDGLADQFDIGNLVDYFLFLNVTTARDNRGTNTYVARHEPSAPWVILPWDLDATFGSGWDGSYTPDSTWVLTNGLIARLLEDPGATFHRLAAERYFRLRSGVLSLDTLQTRIAAGRAELAAHGAARRERERWPGYRFADDDAGILSSFAGRLRRMDAYLAPYAATNTTTELDSVDSAPLRLRAFPNPATTSLTLMFPLGSGIIPRAGELFDADGRSAGTVPISVGDNRLDVSGLTAGVYVLRVVGYPPLRFVRAAD